MQDKTFEDFLQQYHADNNREVLDDDLPDAYEDWVGNLEADEVMELAEKAIIYYQKIYCSMIEKEKEKIFNSPDFRNEEKWFAMLGEIQEKIKGQK